MKLLNNTKLYSIVSGTCPVCHTGKMYKTRNAYKISETLKMHAYCPHCDVKFKIEPSFFYGAMYVSYPVGIAIALAVFIITYFFMGLDRNKTFIAIILALIVLLPLILRVSRNIWINFFFKFDKSKM